MDMFEMELNSEYQHLIRKQTEEILKRLVNKFIRYAQSLKGNCMLSGDDSGLNNTWDEICADMQGEWTFYHQAYLDIIEQYADEVLFETLTELEKTMLWTQTSAFEDWLEEIEENTKGLVCHNISFFDAQCDDAIKEVISEAIISEAMRYTNSRIDKYLYER